MAARIPSYRLHRATGQAVVTLGGKDHYLGRHGTPESRAAYDRTIARWVAGGRRPDAATTGPTVAEVLLAFWDHATAYYRKDDRPTSQLSVVKAACKGAKELFGPEPAAEFTPSKLKAVRQAMVDRGASRSYANRLVAILKQIWAWAAEEELVPGPVAASLRLVKGLAKGRTTAPEVEPIRPVPEADVTATLAVLRPKFAAMVRLQLLTGMRPGEACLMRPCDLDRTGPVWAYTPRSHKTEHHDRRRVIYLGPRAQAILTPLLGRCRDSDYLFPTRQDSRRPLIPRSYRGVVQRACRRAGIPHWHPSQLRHNAATLFRREFGLDTAQVMLGHVGADVTQVYAEADRAKAVEVAARLG